VPKSLAVRAVIALLATRKLVTAMRGRRPETLSVQQRALAVGELRRLVPAPRPRDLGGERIGTDTYERFLSVVEWRPERAAPMLEADLVWRARVKPRACRPEHMPKACAQSGWQVLMVSAASTGAESEPPPSSLSSVGSSGRWHRFDRLPSLRLLSRSHDARPLHPPHYKPRNVQWRYTKHGLPITLIEVRSWFPERAGKEETAVHTAYMMEHYIRRMQQQQGGRVTRACLLLDMRGFRPATLPYVRICIEILRRHYPGRLGAACFYHVPPYFIPVWKLIRPLLDEEIMNKVHFLPSSVKDTDGAIAWCNHQDVPVC
jgi:hypothetical protein